MTTWEPMQGNEILKGEGFFISFNPNPGGGVAIFASDGDQAETAIVVRGSGQNLYFILNGDWRKEYEALFPRGLEACVEFYNQQAKDNRSSWSDK